MPFTADFGALIGDQASVRIVREPQLVERVVCVGGVPGCGKTLFNPLVGSLARVEVMKYNYAIEHVASLDVLGRLDPDVAVTLLRMMMDMDLYHLMMSREANFRWSDLSSVLRNPGTWRYVRRLFQAGDAAAVERVKAERPILHYVTHNVLHLSPSLFRAMGDRLRVLVILRHPLYTIKQWYRYIHRYGEDVRDFTIWFDHEGHAVPFFARGWEDRYLGANGMDRVIYSLERLSSWGREILQACTAPERARILVIPFEAFVLDPWPHLRRLEALLETSITAATWRELKRQRVPRRMIADGIPLPIYKAYGWQPAEAGADERREFQMRRQFAAGMASPEGLAALDRLCAEYETEHLADHPTLRSGCAV